MKAAKLQADEKIIFKSGEYNGPDDRNWTSEIRATADGLFVDGNYVIPWDWILEAMSETDVTPEVDTSKV